MWSERRGVDSSLARSFSCIMHRQWPSPPPGLPSVGVCWRGAALSLLHDLDRDHTMNCIIFYFILLFPGKFDAARNTVVKMANHEVQFGEAGGILSSGRRKAASIYFRLL